MMHRALLTQLSLADLVEPAEKNARLTSGDLRRVLAAGNPLAAAALADARREAVSPDRVATFPVTLRVRAPGVPAPAEDATKVSHAADALAGIDATEMQMIGDFGADLPLAHAVEMVLTLVAARPDLKLRAFTADDVAALARRERTTFPAVVTELAKAGVATLDWRAGADASPDAVRIHRFAHDAGLKTFAPVTYARGALGKTFLERLDALRDVGEQTKSFVSAVLVPERTEGASPLLGTAGTEDLLACAMARLALGHVVAHVTVDAHILGHKLGATLLACGADDFVGAQAALAWAPPTDDGPRPLNPARVTKYIIEARRSPVRRDAHGTLLDS
jgi:aminodeoxyfutalosine synthase